MRNLKIILAFLISFSLSSVAIAGDWSKIRIGTEGAYEPWNFTDASGNLVGAELDLARDLCDRMNAECTFVQQDWDGIIPALVNGKYDVIMAGMSVTDERKKTISFSKAYMTEPARFFTLNNSPLSTFSSAKNLNLDDDGSATSGTISALNNAMKGMNVGVTVAVHRYLPPILRQLFCFNAYKLSPPPFVTVITPPDSDIDAPESPTNPVVP